MLVWLKCNKVVEKCCACCSYPYNAQIVLLFFPIFLNLKSSQMSKLAHLSTNVMGLRPL